MASEEGEVVVHASARTEVHVSVEAGETSGGTAPSQSPAVSDDALVTAADAGCDASPPSPAAKFVQTDCVFQAGPLGMTVNEHRQVIAVVPGSQAASAHVACGDVVLAVAGVDMTSLGYDDVLAAIRQSERPVTITFQRVQTAAAPSVKVAQAAAKAGALMKGILSAGVHVIAAVDRSIDRAFDDSAKQVAEAARETARQVKESRRLAALKASGVPDHLAAAIAAAPKVVPDDRPLLAIAQAQQAFVAALADEQQKALTLGQSVEEALQLSQSHIQQYSADANRAHRCFSVTLPAVVRSVATLSANAAGMAAQLDALEAAVADLKHRKAARAAAAAASALAAAAAKVAEAARQEVSAVSVAADSTPAPALEVAASEDAAAPPAPAADAHGASEDDTTSASAESAPSTSPAGSNSAGRVKEIAAMYDARAAAAAASSGGVRRNSVDSTGSAATAAAAATGASAASSAAAPVSPRLETIAEPAAAASAVEAEPEAEELVSPPASVTLVSGAGEEANEGTPAPASASGTDAGAASPVPARGGGGGKRRGGKK